MWSVKNGHKDIPILLALAFQKYRRAYTLAAMPVAESIQVVPIGLCCCTQICHYHRFQCEKAFHAPTSNENETNVADIRSKCSQSQNPNNSDQHRYSLWLY